MAIRTFSAALLLTALALPAFAAPAEAPSRGIESDFDLLDTTCGSFITTLAVANPGANPDDARKEEAKNAQASAFRAMIWVHGYQAGKRGPSAAADPLTRAWLVKNVPLVADQCKKDPAVLFFKAVEAM